MPTYRIEGADKRTAEDVAYDVEANTEAEAIDAVAEYTMIAQVVRLPDPPPPAKSIPAIGHIQGSGEYSINAVGESNYQQSLAYLAGGKTPDGHNLETTAVLVCDDDNAHDRNAVAVTISGYLVGYLDRQIARSYRKQLEIAGFPDATMSCGAMIVGGWDRGGDNTGHFGVKLDLPTHD